MSLEAQAPEGGEGGEVGEAPPQVNWEAEARAEGWKPEDQYRGPAGTWVDAETFVKRGREINPILRKNNERLMTEINQLRAELQEAGKAVKNLQEYNATLEAKAFERAIKKLKADKRAALAAGDHETVAALEDQLDELQEQKPAPKAAEAPAPAPAAPGVDPIFSAWVTENASWFNDQNPEMVDYANAVGMRLRRQDPKMQTLKGQDFLDAIRAAVAKQFPDKFGKRGGPALVEGAGGGGGGPAGGGGGGKSFASLPPDARSQYKQLSTEKWYKDLAKSQNLTTEQMFMRDYGDGE